MSLYLKYRPQNIQDLDLTNVRESLSKIIKSGDLPHAFLFSGPKGTGKTSAARILAKILNCEHLKANGEPCNKCDSCKTIAKGENIDVIEMDAASHRGIDDIRTLRDAVKLAPARSKYKVYIIDEAHMLTTEASNALLKTLEEPPEHVVFVLATTNPEKLIETIRSRTMNIVFKKATNKEIVSRLLKVSKGEDVKVKQETLEVIAEKSSGSFRDAVKIMEQLILEGSSFTPEDVKSQLYGEEIINLDVFIYGLKNRKVEELLRIIENVSNQSISVKPFTEKLLQILHNKLLGIYGLTNEDTDEFNEKELIQLIKLFTKANDEINRSYIEQVPLELAVIKWCERNINDDDGSKKINRKAKKKAEKSSGIKARINKGANNVAFRTGNNNGDNPLSSVTDEFWNNLLSKVRPKNTSTEALLRAAKPLGFDGKFFKLGVYYSFHKERLEEGQHKRLLEDTISQMLGKPIRLLCQLSQHPDVSEEKSISDDLEVVELENGESVDHMRDEPLTEAHDEDIIRIASEVFGD